MLPRCKCFYFLPKSMLKLWTILFDTEITWIDFLGIRNMAFQKTNPTFDLKILQLKIFWDHFQKHMYNLKCMITYGQQWFCSPYLYDKQRRHQFQNKKNIPYFLEMKVKSRYARIMSATPEVIILKKNWRAWALTLCYYRELKNPSFQMWSA